VHIELKAHGIDLADSLRAYIERRLSLNARPFFAQVIRIRVRVSGLNGPRGGTRTSCRMSIEVKSLGKLVVQESDLDAHTAIDRAAARLGRLLSQRIARAEHLKCVDGKAAPGTSAATDAL
jgi:ribosomal subunit interface protein